MSETISPAGTLSEVWERVTGVAKGEGALRVVAAALDGPHVGLFEQWLERGDSAAMHYLEKNAAVRRNPRERFPWARSVVAITVPYTPHRGDQDGSIASRISRYAQGDDYHDVVGVMLERIEAAIVEAAPGATTRRYVDTGPLSDRTYAAAGGAGWIGRNGMLIDPEHGSWFFIGIVLTSLENDIGPALVADRCGTCTRCLEACPTDAIRPDRTIDSRRCISYLTIEHRGAIVGELRERLAGNLFGCDICQEVCPWNSKAPECDPRLAPREIYRATPVTDLLTMTQGDFSTLFRRSAVKRAKRTGMMRNAILAGAEGDVAEAEDEGVIDALARRRK
jgi:epoxyqueuosine reductase